MGQHVWLLLATIGTELLAIIKWSKGQFPEPLPTQVKWGWAIGAALLVLYPTIRVCSVNCLFLLHLRNCIAWSWDLFADMYILFLMFSIVWVARRKEISEEAPTQNQTQSAVIQRQELPLGHLFPSYPNSAVTDILRLLTSGNVL